MLRLVAEKTKQKQSRLFFSKSQFVCWSENEVSFNPAFVVPEEHLESLEEHFHRCWVHMLSVHSQCLQPSKKKKKNSAEGLDPKDNAPSQTITSHRVRKTCTFVLHSRGVCVKNTKTQVCDWSLLGTGCSSVCTCVSDEGRPLNVFHLLRLVNPCCIPVQLQSLLKIYFKHSCTSPPSA